MLQWLGLLGCRAQAQQLRSMGLAAPQQVGSFPARGEAHVSCIGRWILYHWTPREVLSFSFNRQEIHNYDRKIGILAIGTQISCNPGKTKRNPQESDTQNKNQRLSGSDDSDEADDETLLIEFLSYARP